MLHSVSCRTPTPAATRYTNKAGEKQTRNGAQTEKNVSKKSDDNSDATTTTITCQTQLGRKARKCTGVIARAEIEKTTKSENKRTLNQQNKMQDSDSWGFPMYSALI
eukprot:Opistho-2@88977